MATLRRRRSAPKADPLWYKDAVLYELRVGAFQDSDGDGIGDFRGLTARLDYLRDLGITAIWLLPFYPSPRRDDGYDISDYCGIHPDAGTLDDFKAFLHSAHEHGLRVITELVLNHTSEQHAWFQRARRAAAGSRERDYYVWSDSPDRYREARVIFKDFERSNWTWDPVANAYYWHRFYSHQPDLNFANPAVCAEVLRVLDFWLRLGVDGLRLDAIPYLFEADGTSCENLPETHAFLRRLRAHVDARYEGRMLLAEANQWPEDAVAYFGDGDECHMAFHFPAMPRLFMALHMEDRFPILDILQQTPAIPENCQWALFLRNHDELTLEMVTDEERDYMYRVYAHDTQARINLGIRRRLAPLLRKDRRRMELLNALLLSLPGTPVLYYGDEIGMGDNIYLGDRNGVRTPMQWSSDRNAGFSRANPQRLYLPVIVDPDFHYETTNVEAAQANPHSLLWWTKRLIGLRKRYRAFGRGSVRFLTPANRKVLAFVREYEEERVLIVANLSRFAQHVELELSDYRGAALIEMFGRTTFPAIAAQPYPLTLGPHSFYWFSIESPPSAAEPAESEAAAPVVPWRGNWRSLTSTPIRAELATAITRCLAAPGWLGDRARALRSCVVEDSFELPNSAGSLALLIVRVDTAGSEPQCLAVPIQFVAEAVHDEQPLLLRCVDDDGKACGCLVEASSSPQLGAALLALLSQRRMLRAGTGELVPVAGAVQSVRSAPEADGGVSLTVIKGPSPSFVAGGQLRLHLNHHPVEGLDPEVEIGAALSKPGASAPVPRLVAALEFRRPGRQPLTLAVAHEYVRHEDDLWRYTIDHLKQYFDRAEVSDVVLQPADLPAAQVALLIDRDPPDLILDMIGGYLETARLLGKRVAQLHAALAAVPDPEFVPEPVTKLYRRSLYQSLRNHLAAVSFALREQVGGLPDDVRADAERLLAGQSMLLAVCHRIVEAPIDGLRIRCHGDLQLGRVLHTGRDLVIVGFEGDVSTPSGERRLKRSPLRDVAALLRSLEFAAESVLHEHAGGGLIRPEDVSLLAPWTLFWKRWVGSAFLRSYVQAVATGGLLPTSTDALAGMLAVHLIDRGLSLLSQDLGERPAAAGIRIRGLLELLDAN